ncbi:hypothetical protein GTQ99_00370 [Kineococcus sp. T13]|uniref:hypothetical protein n=1 Tax=Kineococcus vitellinus TaxID=2696565 RepID=UPI001412631E|nr:hypothetical protein [Kineococcus vitellinus]NAZ73885.1 hypothetical protein [Kineococcus vitellinus]
MTKATSYQYGYRAGATRQATYRKQGNGYADPAEYRRGFKDAQMALFGCFTEEVPAKLDGKQVGTVDVQYTDEALAQYVNAPRKWGGQFQSTTSQDETMTILGVPR